MDAIRKQLDVLMGANRNGDVREVNRKYHDRDVCRLFLSGLCPHDLFQLTGRQNLVLFLISFGAWLISFENGHGSLSEDSFLAAEKRVSFKDINGISYEEAKAKGDHNFDRELEDMIERLIVECERKIQRALKRLEDEDAKAAVAISVSMVTQSPEIMELSKQIKEKLKEADAFGAFYHVRMILSSCAVQIAAYLDALVFYRLNFGCVIADFEGKTDSKIRVLEVVEELKAQRADKQSVLLLDAFNKDRASLSLPIQNPTQLPSLPVVNPPDPRTQEMINEKLKKAEDLGYFRWNQHGERGMIDEAQKALEEAEALKKVIPLLPLSFVLGARQEPVLESSKYSAADVRITDQKLRVCDICGAFLSVYDNDRRLADHFGGKLHLGYMQIREKLAELQFDLSGNESNVKIFFFIFKPMLLHDVFARKRETGSERLIGLKMIQDRKKEVGIVTGLEAGIEMQREMLALIAEIEAENMTVGAGTRIGMIEIVGIEIENQIDLETMIQGIEDHVLAQRIVLEIMTGIGVMEGTENSRNSVFRCGPRRIWMSQQGCNGDTLLYLVLAAMINVLRSGEISNV
ncbi:hypothetical protein ZIOFF_055660 [Zingiber officinale]|uniref:LUC7 related protein n=1 Tax=Zingiber officinale TaxID=94328 RepID=A0A8J5FM59_ZINOF|nr:hypothetical protein ZIOFF_055660 [Zingiber officinale]